MFKRVEKRIKKQEEDRALDIDYETREAFGLNETDSDESDDSEESDMFDQQDDDESEEWGGLGYEGSDAGEDYGNMEDGGVDEHDTNEEEDMGDVGEKRQVSFQAFTVDQALKDPIYSHPSQSNASLCALCPGKTLIGPLTISQHQESKAHSRRSKRISELTALHGNKDRDFSDLLEEMDGGKPQVETQGESKRSEKKRKAVEIRKAKREKRKEREKTKKEKQEQDADAKEADDKRPTKPDNAALSDTKKQKDGKHKAEMTSTTKGREDKQRKKSGGEIPQPSASNSNDQANKRKRKPEREREQEQGPAQKTQAPPSKKRKTGAGNAASSSEKIDITRQIKDIAKSASKRAHQALDKASKGSGGGVPKTKGGKKRSG